MHSILKYVLAAIMLLYIFFIFKAVKRRNMKMSYLVFWIITGIGLICALFIPNLVESVSSFIGIQTPVNMLFMFAIFVILYIIYNFMILITKLEKRNTLLIQEISLLKKRVEDLEKKWKEYSKDG